MIKSGKIFIKENLDVLRSMAAGAVDLVYLDPPFNKNRVFASTRKQDTKFRDIFRPQDVRDEWMVDIALVNKNLAILLEGIQSFSSPYHHSYCVYMAIRLLEIRRILKFTGSVYLHADPLMSHYLKLIMDCIFGAENFRNEIIWYYNSGARGNYFGRRHDVILYYAKDAQKVAFYKDAVRVPYSPDINIPKSKAKYYHPAGKVMDDVFQIKIIAQNDKGERTGYPTQKPLELLERIVRASSRAGDTVLDPFCGSGTSLVAAARLGRNWIGIDKNPQARAFIKRRLQDKKA